MKSGKRTEPSSGRPAPARARWYDDACGTAMALELVGERWSLLVVRELMFGPRRFGELRGDLPGISANTLTQRLDGLEAAGIVRRHELPPPASVQVYELTPWGYESEVAIRELGRWAVRSRQHDPTLPLSPASLMMSFRALFDARRAVSFAATLGFELGREGFVVTVVGAAGATGLTIRRAPPQGAGAGVVVRGAPSAVAAVLYAGRPLADAVAQKALVVTGDRALVTRFAKLIPLPPKVPA